MQLSYAADETQARMDAYEPWRTNIFESDVLGELWTPRQFDAIAQFVRPEDLDRNGAVRISANPEQHLEWLKKDLELRFDRLILHNVNLEQEQFIQVFGEKVLPHLS